MNNLGIIVANPRPKDYILGSTSKITSSISVKDWSIYLPAIENQRNKVTDFLDCVTLSALHCIEAQCNYFLKNNLFSDEALNFFNSNHYIQNGVFHFSSRFNAKLNGTEGKGNYLNTVADDIRRDGLLADYDWTVTDTMSDTLFFTDIPIGLFQRARKALWFLNVQYQFVTVKDILPSLLLAPLQVTSEICPGWDSGQIVKSCNGFPLSHATMIYGTVMGNLRDMDHYPPYFKTLAPDYEFPFNLQYVVTLKPIALRNGMTGMNVLKLQQDLNKLGFGLKEDGDFGNRTQTAVFSIQNKTGLKADGIAGSLTLQKIKELITPHTILDAIIQVESQGNDNAEGDKNLQNHAYGCLQIRQGVCDDVNRHFGTTYRAEECLGNRIRSIDIWNKYWEVYPRTDNEDIARTWNGGPGWKQIYFKTTKTTAEITYCNNLDIYWSKVKALL